MIRINADFLGKDSGTGYSIEAHHPCDAQKFLQTVLGWIDLFTRAPASTRGATAEYWFGMNRAKIARDAAASTMAPIGRREDRDAWTQG